MDEFHKTAVIDALKRMFQPDKYFDICTIDTCLGILGVIPDRGTYDALKLYHCVRWSSIEPDVRTEIFKTTVKILSGYRFDLSVLDKIFADQPLELTVESMESKTAGNSTRANKRWGLLSS